MDESKEEESKVHLRRRWSVFERDVMNTYQDTTLVSSEGSTVKLGRVLLAATSPMLCEALRDIQSTTEVVIKTEVSFVELIQFYHFVTTGRLVGLSSGRAVNKTDISASKRNLLTFGVNLEQADLETPVLNDVEKEGDIFVGSGSDVESESSEHDEPLDIPDNVSDMENKPLVKMEKSRIENGITVVTQSGNKSETGVPGLNQSATEANDLPVGWVRLVKSDIGDSDCDEPLCEVSIQDEEIKASLKNEAQSQSYTENMPDSKERQTKKADVKNYKKVKNRSEEACFDHEEEKVFQDQLEELCQNEQGPSFASSPLKNGQNPVALKRVADSFNLTIERTSIEKDQTLTSPIIHNVSSDIENEPLSKMKKSRAKTRRAVTRESGEMDSNRPISPSGKTLERIAESCNLTIVRQPRTSDLATKQRRQVVNITKDKVKKSHKGKRLYECTTCDKSFFESRHLRRHEMIHTGERPFKCTECDMSFRQSAHLTGHMRTHTREKPFKCPYCDSCFAKRSHLRDHERTHTGEKPFKCNTCAKCFSQPQHLKTHEKIHTEQCNKPTLETQSKERQFKCTKCDKSFFRSSHLVDHDRTHTGEKPFMCKMCGKCFSQLQHLSKHEYNCEKFDKPTSFTCICCGKTYDSRKKLYQHRIDSFCRFNYDNCPLCPDITFESWPQHQEHVKEKHEGVFVARCRHCPEVFANNDLRLKHNRQAHPYQGEKAMCPHCGKCTSKLNLGNHIRAAHSDEKASCDICNKLCKSKIHLYHHIRYKHGMVLKDGISQPVMVKPSQCEVCGKSFRSKSNLKVHMACHSGEKKYTCEKCSAAYSFYSGLAKHKKMAHKED